MFDIEPRLKVEEEEKVDVLVIGKGIVGSTVGELLRSKGREVLIIDSNEELPGTKACGGSIKFTPLMGLPKKDEEKIRLILENLFGLEVERFEIRPSGNMVKLDILKVNMEKVWGVPYRDCKALHIDEKKRTVLAKEYKRIKLFRPNLLVIAAGINCEALIPQAFLGDHLYGKRGVTFHFPGSVEKPFVRIWAPFKQVTVHNIRIKEETCIWAGDGTAIIQANWLADTEKKSLERIQRLGEIQSAPIDTIHGIRPFVKSNPKPCFIKRIGKSLWVVTGTGKFGCASAAWAAKEIVEYELG